MKSRAVYGAGDDIGVGPGTAAVNSCTDLVKTVWPSADIPYEIIEAAQRSKQGSRINRLNSDPVAVAVYVSGLNRNVFKRSSIVPGQGNQQQIIIAGIHNKSFCGIEDVC